MRTLIGTSGYSYPAWKGAFYPSDLPASKMLGYYATRFPTVEINNTFYRMPTAKLVQSWADTVPDGFCFAIKAPQQITHKLRLRDAAEPVQALAAAVARLGDKQGPILFQLPPFLRQDLALLTAFLALLPAGLRAAFEFRHASWLADDTYAALRAGGAALCIADTDALTTPLVATTDWGYLRLRREDYRDGDIADWARKIAAQPWTSSFIYFKHEDAGKGPRFAERLRAVM